MNRRNPYAEEFNQEAVKLVTEQGMSVTQVARAVDVRVDTLHRWLREARSVTNSTTSAAASSAEVAQLRRENEQLRTERDILKKAMGVFAKGA